MPRLFSNDQAITPDRAVRVVFDPDETVCTRLAQTLSRAGHQIARGSQVGVGSSENVDIVAESWQLEPVQNDISRINEQSPFQNLIVRASNWNIAVPFSEFSIFRAPTDIPGVVVDGSVQNSGDIFIRNELVAGTNAGGEWADDVAFLSKPPPCLNTNVPVDRIGVGRVLYPKNCGFHLRFLVPGTHLHAQDVIAAFYFGGSSDTSASLGFSLVIFGNGDAELWELSIFNQAKVWSVLTRFSFSPPNHVAGRVHGITIQPHGRNTISFKIASASRAIPHGQGSGTLPTYAGAPPSSHAAKFVANALVSGYVPGDRVTGAGNIRLDVRRALLLAWQVSILDYASSGILIDHEFVFDKPLPAGTVLTMVVNAIVPEGCSLVPDLYAASDVGRASPLAKVYVGGNIWQFSSLPNTRFYFASFAFEGNHANHSSPQLKRYSVQAPPNYVNRVGLNIVFPVDQTDELAVAISGQDTDPTSETAHIRMIDKSGNLVIPRRRGRLKTRVDLGYVEDGHVKVCYLFDGQGVNIERSPFGATFDDYSTSGISPRASLYEGDFVGRWARTKESFGFFVQISDASLSFDPSTGTGSPITVSQAIRDVFNNIVGIPDEMLDIPEFGVPLFGPDIDKDAFLHAKQNPMEYILHLVGAYLGAVLFWDRNAVPRGRWRVQPKIDLFGFPEAPLCRFWFGPGIPGQGNTPAKFLDPIDPATYGDGATWIERDSYDDWIEAPEYNWIKVIAPNKNSSELPNDAGWDVCVQTAWNPDSFDLDPDNPTANPDPNVNPDYVGEILPLVVWDPMPTSPVPAGDVEGGVQGYVNFLARYLIEQYGHARKPFRFRAPLVLIKDRSDPYLVGRRPLRHNDPVWVGGEPAIIRRCNPEGPMLSDFQMCWHTGVFKNVPLP